MRIITIGREFGSGGRELGKRLSDALHIPCYDREIIEEVAKMHGLDPDHVEQISETDIRTVYPMTIGRRFYVTPMINGDKVKVAVSQQEVIKKLAQQGDCVIVGRCADVILRDMHPLNLFVYADEDSKVARCLERAENGENRKMILQQMRKIDRDRTAFHELLTDKKWGEKETYHLCINTSGKEIKQLVPALAEYSHHWFDS